MTILVKEVDPFGSRIGLIALKLPLCAVTCEHNTWFPNHSSHGVPTSRAAGALEAATEEICWHGARPIPGSPRRAPGPAPVPSEMSRGGSVAARARERAWQPERDLAFKFQLKRMEQAEARSVRDHVAAENAKARDHELQMAQMRLEEGKQQMLISFLKAAEKGVFN